jgi:hypothetical protein
MTKAAEAAKRKKTLERKLRDLEDHLHFLPESLSKLASGDESYIKPLSAELRVLICKAGKEGLLWRVVSEIGADDTVHVHFAGKVNFDHPLARGLTTMFYPLHRAGLGDPRLAPGRHSLKHVIREGDALVVQGKAYSFEILIRAVVEQMGTSHEDEGVQPYLIELSETFISNIPVLSQTLMIAADLALEVGDRTLLEALKRYGYVKRNRTAAVVPSEWKHHTLMVSGQDFESPPA